MRRIDLPWMRTAFSSCGPQRGLLFVPCAWRFLYSCYSFLAFSMRFFFCAALYLLRWITPGLMIINLRRAEHWMGYDSEALVRCFLAGRFGFNFLLTLLGHVTTLCNIFL